jgi:Orsellinic acid/F9775 biosynthesis cluster protein D
VDEVSPDGSRRSSLDREPDMVSSPPLDPYDNIPMDVDMAQVPEAVWQSWMSQQPVGGVIQKGKGKEKAVAPSSSLPSADRCMSPLTLPDSVTAPQPPNRSIPIDHTLSEWGIMGANYWPISIAGTPTAVTTAALEAPAAVEQLNLLHIPYGRPEIITSPLLNNSNCIVYKPLNMLICVVCQIGILPQYLRRHRSGAPHFDRSPLSPEQVNSLVTQYNLQVLDYFEGLDAAFAAVPGIPFREGFQCPFPGCIHCRASKKTMGRHIQEKHQVSIRQHPPATCYVQALFESNETWYRIVVPEFAPAPLMRPSMLDYAASTYHAIFDVPPELEDRAHLNPFLAKYDWLPVVRPFSPGILDRWIAMPDETDARLQGLESIVKAYYGDIIGEMQDFGQYTTILRWVKSSKKYVVFFSTFWTALR